jgi:hypothetical protein
MASIPASDEWDLLKFSKKDIVKGLEGSSSLFLERELTFLVDLCEIVVVMTYLGPPSSILPLYDNKLYDKLHK